MTTGRINQIAFVVRKPKNATDTSDASTRAETPFRAVRASSFVSFEKQRRRDSALGRADRRRTSFVQLGLVSVQKTTTTSPLLHDRTLFRLPTRCSSRERGLLETCRVPYWEMLSYGRVRRFPRCKPPASDTHRDHRSYHQNRSVAGKRRLFSHTTARRNHTQPVEPMNAFE